MLIMNNNLETTTKTPFYKKKWFVITGAVLLGLFVLGSMGGNKTTTNTNSPTVTVPEPAKSKVTLETFNKIQTNQTLAEVEALFGKGELMSETDIAGIKSVSYKYNGDSLGSNAILIFSNDKLASKSQFGLK